jgi:hypothetical protein
MSKSSITVAADVAGKVMVSASGNAADRLAMAGAAAVAFIGIAVGYRILAGVRAGLRLPKPSNIVTVDEAM